MKISPGTPLPLFFNYQIKHLVEYFLRFFIQKKYKHFVVHTFTHVGWFIIQHRYGSIYNILSFILLSFPLLDCVGCCWTLVEVCLALVGLYSTPVAFFLCFKESYLLLWMRDSSYNRSCVYIFFPLLCIWEAIATHIASLSWWVSSSRFIGVLHFDSSLLFVCNEADMV